MRVGRDVEASCRKCGEVWHVVVALTDGHVAKVECKQCGARHRFRPVDGVRAGSGQGPRKVGSARARRKDAAPIVEADPSRPRRPFRTSDTYEVGDRVVHASFGEGVVQAVTGPQKVQVLFDAGAKTLVHSRDAG